MAEQARARQGGKGGRSSRVGMLARAVAFLVVALPLVPFCVVWIVSVDADAAWSRCIPIAALLVFAVGSRFLVVEKDTGRALSFFVLSVFSIPVFLMFFRGGF